MTNITRVVLAADSTQLKTAKGDLDKLQQSGEKTQSTATAMSSAFIKLGTAIAGALSIREIVQYADAWQSATNQLKTVQKETEDLVTTQHLLMKVANDSRMSFDATATLYTRLSRSTESLNLTQAELIDLTDTINKSFAVSGASAQEATNAIIQLSQGLSVGALRGEEFNSVSEQSPILMQAIADSLKMTRGELRAFAAEGGITAQIVVTALQQASGQIDRTFSKMSATFEQNMTKARNNLLEFIGSSEAVQRATSLAGSSIVMISENIDELGNIAIAAGAGIGVLATVHLVKLISGLQAAAVAQGAFNAVAALNPYVLLATGVAALTYGLISYTEKQKEATAALNDYVRGTTILDPLKAAVLKQYEENAVAIAAETEVVVESTQAVTRNIDELRKNAVQLDHGRHSTAALTEASQNLIGKLSTVRMSYEDMIPILSRSEFVMQGVTKATNNQAEAVGFWTKVAEDGAERRTAAEAAAAQQQQENWQRTHEYLSSTFVDIMNNGKDAFSKIGDAFKAMIQRMIAEWAASKLMNLFGIGSGAGGSATGIIGSLIGGGGSMGSIAGSVGSAASGALGGIGSAAAAIPGWGWALAGVAAAAALLNKESTPSSNAGMLVGPAPGAAADRTFSVSPFASGFQPTGFARREDQGAAMEVINSFGAVDLALTSAIRAAGGYIDMSAATLAGFSESGRGAGVFMGLASEQGSGVTSVPIEQQLTQYAQDVMRHASGLTEDQKAAILAGVHGSHASGLSYVPFDGYRAELHRGEEVLRANDPRNINNLAGMSDKMEQLTMQIALYSRRMSQIIDDWNARGLPPERLA